jgi:hypothetical protein
MYDKIFIVKSYISYVWPHFTVKNATSLYGTRAYAKNALEDALQSITAQTLLELRAKMLYVFR